MAEKESRFKWNNRKKATETAVKFKIEDGMAPEEAVKKVMAEYEGVYFVHGDEISEKRYNNFITRVEKEKKYKASKSTPTEVDLSQTKIKAMLDKGELTDLQAAVLDSVYNQLASYRFGTSDVSLADVAEDSGIKQERVKGALGHLVKKGFLYTEEQTIGDDKVNVIFIAKDKQELFNDDLIKYQELMEAEGENQEEPDPAIIPHQPKVRTIKGKGAKKEIDATPEDITPEAIDPAGDDVSDEEMEKVLAELKKTEGSAV